MDELKRLFLFRGLSDERIEALCADLPAPRRFARGEVIYDATHFERGVAESDGVVRNRFQAGSVFGAAAVFGASGAYVSFIRAQTDAVVRFLPEAFLRECIRTEPVCAENYVAFLSERIRYLNHKIRQYTAPDAQTRVYRYLASSADKEGRLQLKNLSEVTRLLGMGRTSLYRALGELEQSGVIRRDGKYYHIERNLS